MTTRKSRLKTTVSNTIFTEREIEEQYVLDDMIRSGICGDELEDFKRNRRIGEWKKENCI